MPRQSPPLPRPRRLAGRSRSRPWWLAAAALGWAPPALAQRFSHPRSLWGDVEAEAQTLVWGSVEVLAALLVGLGLAFGLAAWVAWHKGRLLAAWGPPEDRVEAEVMADLAARGLRPLAWAAYLATPLLTVALLLLGRHRAVAGVALPAWALALALAVLAVALVAFVLAGALRRELASRQPSAGPQ